MLSRIASGSPPCWTPRGARNETIWGFIHGLLDTWFGLALVLGLVYWTAHSLGLEWIDGLHRKGGAWTFEVLADCVYFSFVSALSIGYGDLVPVGMARWLAVGEGAAGLLVFGLVISKLVSRRQEELLEETHAVAFEVRLGRIRTNLHMVLSELQAVTEDCEEGAQGTPGAMTRAESAITVFDGELRAIHELLFRPVQMVDEEVLEGILANLAACLAALADLLACLPPETRGSHAFEVNLRHVRRHAVQICGECVPRDHAEDLRLWMDRIQSMASRLEVSS